MELGKNILHLVQLATTALGEAGLTVANETDSSHSISNSIVDETTKTGRIVGYGNNSETIDLTMYALRGDKGQEATLDAIRNKVQLKIWKVDTVPGTDTKYDADFGYGVVESYEESAGAEGFREISVTVQIIGEMKKGKLDDIPQALKDFAAYGFEKPGQKSGEYGTEQTEQP